MSVVETLLSEYEFNRQRTLGLLDQIEGESDPMAALAWRAAPGRASIAWQLMHIGITEEMFATERLASGKQGAWQELWPRFRGGSTPDDDPPSPAQIREILQESRSHLIDTLRSFGDDRLDEIPESLAKRGWTIRTVLSVISWHESHHQGQAHATFNLFKAAASA